MKYPTTLKMVKIGDWEWVNISNWFALQLFMKILIKVEISICFQMLLKPGINAFVGFPFTWRYSQHRETVKLHWILDDKESHL